MKLAVSLLAVVTGCGVSPEPSEQGDSPNANAADSPNTALPDNPMTGYRYRLVPIPQLSGGTTAGHLVCAGSTVVASQQSPSGQRAIVFDYRTLEVTDLGSLGGAISTGRDGNVQGVFVGSSSTATSGGRAFVYRNGVMSELPGIGGNENGAYAINASGQIVGQGQIPGIGDVDQHALLWEPGCSSVIDLGTLDGGYSYARAINDAGVIVGSANVGNGVNVHAVMWGTDHAIVDLGNGGAQMAQAKDINASGLIAASTTNPNRAVVIDDGVFIDLGSLGGGAFATALNDRGDVVGSTDVAGQTGAHAFLYENGVMLNLEELVEPSPWRLMVAEDICDNGVIAGNGMFNGVTRGFVLVPNQ